MNISREEIKALKTLMQDGSNYTVVGKFDRCDNCYERTNIGGLIKHLADCEVGIVERFLNRYPDVKTDMNLTCERVAARKAVTA